MPEQSFSVADDILRRIGLPAVNRYIEAGCFRGDGNLADEALVEMALELSMALSCVTARGELIARLKQTIAEQDLEIQRLEARNGT